MNLRSIALCSLLGTVLALTGCDSGRQALPKVAVRIVNAAPGFSQLSFRREQDARSGAVLTLGFTNVQQAEYDIDTYDFFVFEPSFNGGPEARSWTFAPTLTADTLYTFVLTESAAGEIVPVILEAPLPSATEAQVTAVHAGTTLPAMDLYLERPGVGIAGATPLATLAPGGQLTARNAPSGEYELWLTAAGDPSDVRLATTTFTLPTGEPSTFVITAENGRSTSEVTVVLMQSSLSTLIDRNATSELRVINAATDGAPRDFVVDNQFATPLFSSMSPAVATAYAQVPVNNTLPFAVTPVANPGVLELNSTFGAFVTQRATMLVTGPTGTLVFASGADDNRRLYREAKIRFINAAQQFAGGLEYVVTPIDGDPNQTFALTSVGTPGMSQQISVTPGEYDLYLRLFNTTTLVAGPTRIVVAGAGLYSVLAINGADTATGSIVLLDDFAP